jgi:glycogen debranching enzyme
LIQQQPDQTTSLAFLSYEDKLLAGTWRFLTYFGRDSMISMLLMQTVLSDGESGAIEAVIGAVLERINRTDGTVCHEEVIGDYATYLNLKDNITSTEPRCDYKMVDTDYFLPIALQNYFVDTETGRNRSGAFFNTTATFLRENDGLTYEMLAEITVQKIMNATAAFAAPGGQIMDNLIHLRDNEPVGEWRDSNNGLGGGRIPYDVNAALVPAGLRAIAALSRAGYFANHPEWNGTADRYAQIWEDSTLQFFKVSVPQPEAVSLVESYVMDSNLSVPTNAGNITGDVVYYGVALNGNIAPPNNASSSVVPLMNTDDCFRHFLLNTTNQGQLSAFLSQTADHILHPFPVGLASDVGLFVANPTYSGNTSFAAKFTRGDYHGTVVWGWQLAMMGAGLGRQLGRCDNDDVPGPSLSTRVITSTDSCIRFLQRQDAVPKGAVSV